MNEFQRHLRVLRNQIKRWAGDTFAESKPKQKAPDIKMCPTCGRFVDAKATECSYCNTLLNPKPQPTVHADGSSAVSFNPTLIVFLICATLYMGSVMMSYSRTGENFFSCLWSPSKVYYDLGASLGAYNVLEGQWWRFITYGFLHGSILHIFFNMSWLASMGPMVWVLFGTRRFWLLTFITIVGGSLMSAMPGFLFNAHTSTIGFSGAIFGFMGALFVHFRQTGQSSQAALFKSYLIWGHVICIVLTFAGLFGVDNLAHFGGMFAGMGMAWLFNQRAYIRLGETFEQVVLLAFWAAYGFGIFKLVMAIQTGTTYGA